MSEPGTAEWRLAEASRLITFGRAAASRDGHPGFSAERAQPHAWAATTRRLAADPTMVWLHLPPEELIQRLTRRALARDGNKIHDSVSFLTGLDLEPPVVPHLALDASEPTATLVRAVLDHLSG